MRRTIFAGLIAASLGVPAAAMAKPNIGLPSNGTLSNHVMDSPLSTTRGLHSSNGVAIGAGMEGGNEPGHVTGPGNAPIDNSTRGPLNDVQPGRGSADTRQSQNPKPAY